MEASALHLAWLKSAIPPNVGNSGVQFLIVGDCVRAIPQAKEKKRLPCTTYYLGSCLMCNVTSHAVLKTCMHVGKGVHGEWDVESDSLTYCNYFLAFKGKMSP